MDLGFRITSKRLDVGAGYLIDELFTVYLSDRNICSTQRFFWSCPGWT